MAQLINITSEALQATVRRLLPSQQGFGEDLQATNVVTPIIDLTPTAEGSSVPSYLQRAINLGGATRIDVQNTTATLVTGGGFYEAVGVITLQDDNTVDVSCGFQITDGLSTTIVFDGLIPNRASDSSYVFSFDLVFFLRPGDSLQVFSDNGDCFVKGSLRQIADSNGNLVNPTGFTPQ